MMASTALFEIEDMTISLARVPDAKPGQIRTAKPVWRVVSSGLSLRVGVGDSVVIAPAYELVRHAIAGPGLSADAVCG